MRAGGSHVDSSAEAVPSAEQPGCPVCGAPLAPQRGAYRCPRCHFVLCVGCEAAPPGGAGDGD